ncbi:pyridine nucleotide-disulfide oxidoreductase [Klebsiella pneumoniae]|uniref:Pyridine nucleotide-disulfide oxidoreductase n=1 Tax=Klebsiella pneumoniae TaxID=573 RepID=A0A3S4GQ59_KLEPN|nr:pyridine nucleotide-disulfide oxidoreductase [Klebsiella pneumoniae]
MNTLRCDILILGAGPAGMAAALSAAACDKQVIILDDNPAPGGQIWRAGPQATLPALAPALPRRHRRVSRHPGSERRAADCPPLRAQRAV